uniref:Uncharacterized protein n=1 Tax=viral metagenome TaxID=1070528 RepID=A0A6H1ZEF0_9ZZZZ
MTTIQDLTKKYGATYEAVASPIQSSPLKSIADKYGASYSPAQPINTGFDIWGGIKTFAEGLTKLPKAIGASVLQATQGQKGASVVNKDWADRFIESANVDLNKFVSEVSAKYGEKKFFPGIKITDIAQLPQNMAYSLTSMGSGIAAGVPLAFAPIPGARVAAWGVGTAASGATAYQMTTYQIMQQYLEAKNDEKVSATGKGLTEQEEALIRDDFDEKAAKYGLWEAVPEAISNLAFASILTAPLTKIVGKSVATKIVGKLAGIYGEELLTETITQKGQSAIEVEAGFRSGKIGWVEAFKEVAPQTFLLTTVMAGAGSAIVGVKTRADKITNSLKKEIGEKHLLYKDLKGGIEEGLKQIQEEVKPIPEDQSKLLTPKELSNKAVESFQFNYTSLAEVKKQLKNTFSDSIIEEIIKDIPETKAGIKIKDIALKIELTELQKQREGGSLTKLIPTIKPIKAVSIKPTIKKGLVSEIKLEEEVKPTEKVIPTPETKPSGLAKSIEQKAIEANLTKGFKDLAEYTPSTIKEQAKLVSDLINSDIEKARKIVKGEESLPEKIRGSSLILGIENYLKKNPNADLAYELANSPLVSEVSKAGSELGLMQDRIPDSYTAKLQEVRKARELKIGDITKKKSESIKKIKESTEKINLSKEETSWDNFLKKITC